VSVENLLVQICEDRATLTNRNPGILVHDAVFQKLCGKLDPESVRAATTALSGFAPFVLPVFFAEKRDVNAPNRHNLAELQALGLVDCIAPDDVPAGVIVVRLQSHGRVEPFDSSACCGGGFSFPRNERSGKRCWAMSGFLCFL
jgi:hypothetical protein